METTGKQYESLKGLYEKFPPVQIETGIFKYIQIKVTDSSSGDSIIFVRGSARHEYHKYILEEFRSKLLQHVNVRGVTLAGNSDGKKLVDTIDVSCPGGGRIEHSEKDKTICVYGYSMAYGPGDHPVTVQMIKEAYPSYPAENITIGDKEY